jgi:transposase InsO family protein
MILAAPVHDGSHHADRANWRVGGGWMRRGFLYLVVIMDWYSHKVLSWRLSNTMDAGFCVEALKDA